MCASYLISHHPVHSASWKWGYEQMLPWASNELCNQIPNFLTSSCTCTWKYHWMIIEALSLHVVLKWTLLPDLPFFFSYSQITLGVATTCWTTCTWKHHRMFTEVCAVPWPSKLTLLPHPQFVPHSQIVPYMYLKIPQDVYWGFSSTLRSWHHFQSQSWSCSIKPKWAWHMYNIIIF